MIRKLTESLPTLDQAKTSWKHIIGAVLIALAPELIAHSDSGWDDVLTPVLLGRFLAALGAVLYAGAKVDLR